MQQLQPWEAALLAGIIQSPTENDPADHPIAARERREVVLQPDARTGLHQQDRLPGERQAGAALLHRDPGPAGADDRGVDVGYFTSWVQQQVIERYGAPRAFDGGLKIKTTLNLELQRAAEQAVNNYLANPEGPSAALVAIENSTGEVRAMVGGRNYDESPFNLATQGERQPGSSFKAFDLGQPWRRASPPTRRGRPRKRLQRATPHGVEKFVVHNDEGAYTGENTLTGATAYSDNSIFAEVGLKVGTKKIARSPTGWASPHRCRPTRR